MVVFIGGSTGMLEVGEGKADEVQGASQVGIDNVGYGRGDLNT